LTMFDSDTSAQLRYSELALAAAERSDSGEAKGYAAVTRLTALVYGGLPEAAVEQFPHLLELLPIEMSAFQREFYEIYAEAQFSIGNYEDSLQAARTALSMYTVGGAFALNSWAWVLFSLAKLEKVEDLRVSRDQFVEFFVHNRSSIAGMELGVLRITLEQLREALSFLPEGAPDSLLEMIKQVSG
jgi:tetratricopeptide (TPR) repeat protein